MSTPKRPAEPVSDPARIDDAVLALLWLTAVTERRAHFKETWAWKGHDWDALGRLIGHSGRPPMRGNDEQGLPECPSPVLDLARSRIIRPRDLSELKVHRQVLADLVESGELVRTARGLYVAADFELTEHHSLAEAAKCWPQAVICHVYNVMCPYLETLS